MIITEASGRIEGGILLVTDRRHFDEDIRRKKNQPVKIKVETEKIDQSDEQRGYYHSTVKHHVFRMLNEAGYQGVDTVAKAHYVMKWMFLPRIKIINPVTGEVIEEAGSTSGLDWEGYSKFLQSVIDLATEMGYYIPPPVKNPAARKRLPKPASKKLLNR